MKCCRPPTLNPVDESPGMMHTQIRINESSYIARLTAFSLPLYASRVQVSLVVIGIKEYYSIQANVIWFYQRDDYMTLRIVLEPSEDGGYTTIVPSLPGCISEGENREEALKNIKEAIALYLQPIEDDFDFAEDAELVEISV